VQLFSFHLVLTITFNILPCFFSIYQFISPPCIYLYLSLHTETVNKVNPSLNKFAEAQEEALLKINLDIGDVEMQNGNVVIKGNRLGIDNMLLKLHGHEKAGPHHVNLPGANGPNPQLSSGPKSLVVVNQGKYVDLTGVKSVKLENPAWEMIWRNNANAGALICAFHLAEEVKRNDAALPKGRFYLTFPIWTTASLQDLRERKAIAEEKAVEAMARHENEVRMMQETNNPLMKALHFRNACKAHEDLDYSGYRVSTCCLMFEMVFWPSY